MIEEIINVSPGDNVELKTIIVASGYFDPVHIGHIDYLNQAAKLGNYLIVIINNDFQSQLKKGKAFMPEQDRLAIISNLKSVNEVFLSIDIDQTVCSSIRTLADLHKVSIFAKGGDRLAEEIPESSVCLELGIEIVDGLGNKIRSSSELIAKARE